MSVIFPIYKEPGPYSSISEFLRSTILRPKKPLGNWNLVNPLLRINEPGHVLGTKTSLFKKKVCNSLESFKHRVFILILIVRQFAKPGLYFFQSLQKNPPNLVFIFGYSLLKIRQTWFLFVFVFQGISHRYLPGDDLTDCSFIFLYILCTMSIRYMCIYIRNQLKRPALPPVL